MKELCSEPVPCSFGFPVSRGLKVRRICMTLTFFGFPALRGLKRQACMDRAGIGVFPALGGLKDYYAIAACCF